MVLGGTDSDRLTVRTEHKIKRKRAGGCKDIITEPEEKMYRISSFKRRRLVNNTSDPFGYISDS
jgi:hypothetical protein